MSDDLKIEYTLIRIRDKLNFDKVKLWLPPYRRDENTKQDDYDEDALEKLAEDYSKSLGVDKNVCFTALQELQNHALDKLREKEVYKETGVAVVKVKISGISNSNSITASKIISVHINLSSETNSLQKAVSEQIDILPERIKLISSGKVLNNIMTLDSQGIKHGMQIMAVILSLNSTDLQEYEKQMKILSRMKKDVKLLAAGMDSEDMYLQLTDQSGKSLNLPKEERKALITAMALHEKGKAALKKDEFALALVFFLEADKEYSTCQSQLLNSVDNYALLNLDIAWCYLCLKNVTQLPDAEKRLKMCESKFKFSYGPNLERLIALKGSSGNEAALLMRLHLLQGIVLFHQNKREEARRILMEAQQELSVLKVDDNSLSALIELGLTPAEARMGLRATKGCVNSAVDYIHRRRQEREHIRKQEKEEKERRKLGKCLDNNQYVDGGLVSNLEAMGFSRVLAIEALRHSNNNINEAVNMLHQSPDLLNRAMSMVSDSPIFKELIQQVASIGYDPQMATLALKRHNGDIEKAVEELMACGGRIVDDGNMPSSSSSTNNEESRLHKLKKTQEAYNRFSEDVQTDYDDHLDLTLEQEEKFLAQYLSLLI